MKKLVAVAVGVMTLASVAWADDQPRVLSVWGEASALVTPTKAVLVVGTSAEAPAAAKAASSCATRAKRLLEALRKVARCKQCISTAGYKLEPVFEWDKGKKTRRLRAYRASNYLRLELPASSHLGRVIDAVVEAGATEIKGPLWRVEGKEKLLERLMAEAVANARARAKVLAKAAGAKLGKPLEIRLVGRPEPMGRGYLMGGTSTPLVPGVKRVRVRVECVFELKKD